jgi:hypothetical protein
MRSTYRVLAYLVVLGVVLQAASIAFAWFSVLNEVDSGTVIDESYEGNAGHALHGMVGLMAIPLVALLLLIVSFFAKVPGGVKWAAIVLGVAVLQVMLAFVAFGAPVVGALHGINALVLAVVGARAARQASVADAAPAAAPRVSAPA